MMSGYVAMDGSFFSYAAFGGSPGPELKPRIECILNEQYRQVKQLLEQNREAVIAIAEALILRNELTDIDVNGDPQSGRGRAPLPAPGRGEGAVRLRLWRGAQARR